MTIAYIALGSNLGQRHDYLLRAVEALGAKPEIEISAYSRIYETDPVGGPADQGAYLNAVVKVRTTLTAVELLDRLQAIEEANGRTRTVQWGPRTLDLDLLIFGDEVIETPYLTVPHPRLKERSFVLAPLCDISPNLLMPGQVETCQEWLKKLGPSGLEVTELGFEGLNI